MESDLHIITFGNVAKAVERSTREIRELMLRLLGPAADEGGAWLAEEVHVFRVKRAIARMERASEILTERQIEPKPVPLNFFEAFYQGASLEHDEFLQEAWSGLLVAAAVRGRERITYPRILLELEPLDAHLLDDLSNGKVITKPYGTAQYYRWEGAPSASSSAIYLAVQNLYRLRLIEKKEWSSGDAELQVTIFGRDFWRACQGRSGGRVF